MQKKTFSKRDQFKTLLGVLTFCTSVYADTLSVTICAGETNTSVAPIITAFIDMRMRESTAVLQAATILDKFMVNLMDLQTERVEFSPLTHPTMAQGNLVIHQRAFSTGRVERQQINPAVPQQIFRPANERQVHVEFQDLTLRRAFEGFLRQNRYSPDAAVACGGNETIQARIYRQDYVLQYSVDTKKERQRARLNMSCIEYEIEQKTIQDFIFCTYMKTRDPNFEMNASDPKETEPDLAATLDSLSTPDPE